MMLEDKIYMKVHIGVDLNRLQCQWFYHHAETIGDYMPWILKLRKDPTALERTILWIAVDRRPHATNPETMFIATAVKLVTARDLNQEIPEDECPLMLNALKDATRAAKLGGHFGANIAVVRCPTAPNDPNSLFSHAIIPTTLPQGWEELLGRKPYEGSEDWKQLLLGELNYFWSSGNC